MTDSTTQTEVHIFHDKDTERCRIQIMGVRPHIRNQDNKTNNMQLIAVVKVPQ